MSNNLGFTMYPSDWWSSDTFFEFTDAVERYIFLECLFIMYRNGGYMKTQKTQFENRIRILVSDEVWAKVTSKFIQDENGFTSLTVNKRLKKAMVSRENGKSGGRPPKDENPENPTLKPKRKEKEIESKREIESEQVSDWVKWGELIVQDRDQFWQQMKGRKISQSVMDRFLSVASSHDWKMPTQHRFRLVLNGYDEHKFSNGQAEQKNKYKVQ